MNVKSFFTEVWDDYKSPSTSAFVTKLPLLKTGIGAIDQLLEADHSGLTRLKKSVKAAVSSGNSYVENELLLAESLEKISALPGQSADGDDEIASAFLKFAVVSKDLSSLMKNLINSLGSIVLCPLDNFLKNDLKEAAGDLRKSFDKSWKEYDTRFHKIEKDRIRMADAAGLHKTSLTGPEVAEETEKERKQLQLHATEYFIKVNEIKTKKNVELLNHLVDFYQAQTSFFQDGLKTMGHFNSYVKGLVPRLTVLQQEQDRERRELTDLRDSLRNSLASYREQATPSIRLSSTSSQQPSSRRKEAGTEKVGYLMKKSEGKIKKVWQKRKCEIRNGVMYINHSSESKQPVRLNLLTCSAKLIVDDPSKKCFDLLSSSNNRTYHFQAEDEKDFNEWIAILNNAKEEQLLKAFSDSSTADSINQNVKELTSRIIADVKLMPGNSECCDCTAAGPEWLSTNFGVLICLECCGVHREMGVHVSRTQSIVIDDLCTSQLLMARVMGNKSFNDIMEATMDPTTKSSHIKPSSPRDERNAFIRAKYESRKFAIRTCSSSNDLVNELIQAVDSCEMSALLQVYAEGLDLMIILPSTEVSGPGGIRYKVDETALHRAIRQDESTTLHIIDFLVQNATGNRLETKDSLGNTALHGCATYNRTEAMKLVLKTRPNLAVFRNSIGKTPLDIAKENGHHVCAELIQHALAGKTSLFENVNVDWTFGDDDFNEFSDDDLDASVTSPEAGVTRFGLALPPTDLRERRRASDIFETTSALARDKQQQRRGGTSLAAADVEASIGGSVVRGSDDPAVRRKLPGENGTSEGGTPAASASGAVAGKPAASVSAAATPPAVHMVRAASAAASSAAASAVTMRERRKTVDSVHLMPPPSSLPPAVTQTSQPTSAGLAGGAAAAAQAAHFKTKSLTAREGKMIEAAIGNGNGLLVSAFLPHHARASSDSTRNLVMASSSSTTAPALSLPPMAGESPSPAAAASPNSQQPPPLPEKKHKPAPGSLMVLPPPPQFMSVSDNSGKSDSIGAQSGSGAVTAAGVPDDRSQNVTLQSVHRRSSIVVTSAGGKPTPPPRPQINTSVPPIRKRCRAVFDCKADNEDELSFCKDEVIVILRSPADSDWWYGEIDGNPKRRGLFPITFITLLKE